MKDSSILIRKIRIKKLNKDLLNSYINNFHGYGNLKGKYWFIGIEEGGGESIKVVRERIRRWEEIKSPSVADIHKMQTNEFFNEKDQKPPIQRTWKALIRILLAIKGRINIDKEDVREFQKNQLGRKDSNNCLLELLPLSSPNIGEWKYDKWSNLKFLKDRESYKTKIIPKRISYVQKIIRKYQPGVVTFYSMSKEYMEYWNQISSCSFLGNGGLPQFEKKGKTLFVCIAHPAAFGVSNEYYENIGKKIKKRLK